MFLLDGKKAANELKAKLIEDIKKYNKGRNPKLAILISAKDSGSISYLKGRQKLASEIGIDVDVYDCEHFNQDEMVELVDRLSNDNSVDGIMIDRPLGNNIDEEVVFAHLNYKKDIDGCTLHNLGLLYQGRKCHVGATARAVLELLKYYKIPLDGENIAVLGRSRNVGKPLFLLLNNEDATVTLCHSKTKHLPDICKTKDIVIVAIGKKELIDEKYFNPNSVVIDVGIHYDEDGKMVGDVKRSVKEYVKAISPVPGGVGPLTNIALMQNLLENYRGDDIGGTTS
ncbi:TPA: bifunctional 5,10-methylenetetrahydrofolate dehydrogenase/5,10-methenyltetrahydrofolate cyclohydrolase [bacterium]|jgi:methylenetetrahydrofolate dehydrogenase (NADP+)/methenyltetrahydrofolate cyclohydrolase|nr:bifunctional 5,10-methylenetetrahydrofolate dehydrogenase/5,10-methenyltetrahydrofolate cyclohydrolase [bacterium]